MAAFAKASAAKAQQMRGKWFVLNLTWGECLTLMDVVDGAIQHDGAQLLRIQRRLHTFTGEEMPPEEWRQRSKRRGGAS